MMSEFYDHYHRWEPLAEFHFNFDDDINEELEEDNYVYCLCSRAFIRDGVKTYYVDKEDGSESDVEVLRDSQSQDDQSHVHFSLDTSYKVKCEKDESASCYCSASHTDNYCSTDEHDPAQILGTTSHALQPSDSGADLTYQDGHSDYTTHDKLEKMDQDFPIDILEFDENYLSEDTWEKFWAVNGERLIWASWIKKYSDYINPSYLDENHDLIMDESNIPKQKSFDQIYSSQTEENQKNNEDENIRERKFSYDSKVNPYKSHASQNAKEKVNRMNEDTNKDESWISLARKRSFSEHDRILSPRTVAGTDSMTNVTKITLSSYDVGSSHVTSESTPTDDYSMSSSTSDDQSNDQTRIANVEEILEQVPSEELDTEQYWQFLWKKHFGDQYAVHYANYLQTRDSKNIIEEQKDVPIINVENVLEKIEKVEEKLEIECENSEGNSQEMPSVIEVSAQVDKIKLEEKVARPKKKAKKKSNRVISSVGMLLQTLLKEEHKNKSFDEGSEPVDTGDSIDKTETSADVVDGTVAVASTPQKSVCNSNLKSYSYDDGDEDPPEEKPVSLKRSHEVDDEIIAAEKVKSTFEIMGFCMNPDNMPKGELMYRKRIVRLRPPRQRKFMTPRKTYFDDDGNPYQPQDSHDEREMQTDDDCTEAKSRKELKLDPSKNDNTDTTTSESDQQKAGKPEDTIEVPALLQSDMDGSISSVQDNDEQKGDSNVVEAVNPVETTKRRRRPKRHQRTDMDESEIPPELRDDPKMIKYWKKRHSLFHRFDEGIKLDRESWFSVTPESVAWHIANKFAYDTVLDAFCGAGGNTIQFARTCQKVIAIDIDPLKIEMAKHNATVYGVQDRIEFIVGDFFELAPQLCADMVFLSPPWGGPKYSEIFNYDLETMLEPRPASELLDVARNITPNIALYLPRNTKSDQLLSLAKVMGGSVEVEQSYLDKRFVAITAYFYQDYEL